MAETSFGFVKVNIDGALNIPETLGGIGVVIMDVDGIVVGACSLTHAVKAIDFAADIYGVPSDYR